tara:strand:+ start:1261 stop:1803 length:543 start_codon:yes stop_codon:yes gene_type:complete
MYFSTIPKIYYDSADNKQPKIVTNLLRRVGVRAKVKTNSLLFDTYDVKEGDTPESIAHKLYGDSELHWIIMLTNNVIDRYHNWPLSGGQFNSYVNQKYVDSDGNPNPSGVHHYEIEQESGDTSVKIEVTDLTNYPNASTVTNFEYELQRQDDLRKIKLLDSQYVKLFIEEYENLMNETSI